MRFFLILNSASCPTCKSAGCLVSVGRISYSISSVRSKYCGHTFSSEFTCVTPTDAHRLPNPDSPLCFAPQATASIFSSIPLTGWSFFLAFTLRGTAEARTRTRMSERFLFIIPPWWNSPPSTNSRRVRLSIEPGGLPRHGRLHSTRKWEGRNAGLPLAGHLSPTILVWRYLQSEPELS